MKCPCCNGEGGETEAVLDYGQGHTMNVVSVREREL
jgi:hypothetical protein